MTKPKQSRIPQTQSPEDAAIEAAVETLEAAIDHAKSARETVKAKRLELLDLMDAHGRESVTVNGRRVTVDSERRVRVTKVPKRPAVEMPSAAREKIEAKFRKQAARTDRANRKHPTKQVQEPEPDCVRCLHCGLVPGATLVDGVTLTWAAGGEARGICAACAAVAAVKP